MPKMRRLTAYVTGTVASSAAVTLWAFFERPNFYSAAVYLSQSSACLLVLSNLAFLAFISVAYALQRLLFGRLRPIEIEQLYERGWIAATEWLFAMSIFRDEFGPWYLSMFMLLFMGKVWGWLADGRVEVLEQQTPANPYLFHTRLLSSLVLYVLAAGNMFWYCLDEVVYEARPGVMIMFVFEWAIICIGAFSVCFKYGLWAYEQMIIQKQEKSRREELRREAREAREAGTESTNIEEEMDIHDLDLPGWEAKGTWIFGLDIATDFLKLVAYVGFFTILTMFYGIPIYIIRDVYMTMRSFTKRIHDYIKFENATRDMHTLYPDASVQDLEADNTCIVCREEMYPWIGSNPVPAGDGPPPPRATSERKRPKKLPCGHILHFQCLRSWLERQQACPICRRSVLDRPAQANGTTNAAGAQGGANGAARNGGNRQGQNAGQQPGRPNNHHHNRPGRQGGFNFALGPIRIIFGAIPGAPNGRMLRIERNGPNQQPPAANMQGPTATQNVPAVPPSNPANNAQSYAGNSLPATTPSSIAARFPDINSTQPLIRNHILHTQLNAMETYLWQAIQHANVARERIGYLRMLQMELERTRIAMNNLATTTPPPNVGSSARSTASVPVIDGLGPMGPIPIIDPSLLANGPPALALPEGWRMLPLQSLANNQQQSNSSNGVAPQQPPAFQMPMFPPQQPTNTNMPQNNNSAGQMNPNILNPLHNLQATFANSAHAFQDLFAQAMPQPGVPRPHNPNSITPRSSSPLADSSSSTAVPPSSGTTTVSYGPVAQSTVMIHPSEPVSDEHINPANENVQTPGDASITPQQLSTLLTGPSVPRPTAQPSSDVPAVEVSSPTSPVRTRHRSPSDIALGQDPTATSSSAAAEPQQNGGPIGGAQGWGFGDMPSNEQETDEGHQRRNRQPTVEDALDFDDVD